MDIVEIEKTLTKWAADILGLTVDEDIFRGNIPTGKTGVAVILGSEIYSETRFRPRTYNLQIIGKYENRDEAFRMLSKLSGSLPIHETNIYGVRFKSISQRGDSEPYKTNDNGKEFYYGSFNAVAVVLTSGVQM
jgi:hypothetical protein